MNFAQHVGEQIRRHRESIGLTQTGLSKAASVPQSTISETEAGLSVPSFETAVRFAKAMGCKTERFTRGWKVE